MLWEYVTIFFLPCQMQESVFSVCLLWQSGELSENTKYDLPKVMTLRSVSAERLPAGTRNSSSPLLNSPYQPLVSAGSLQVSHYQLQPSAFSLLSRILAFRFALCLPFFSWSKRSHWFSAVQPFPAMRNDLFQTPSLLGLKLKANFSSQSSKLLYFLNSTERTCMIFENLRVFIITAYSCDNCGLHKSNQPSRHEELCLIHTKRSMG